MLNDAEETVYLDERRRFRWRREGPLADAAALPQPAGDQALSVTLLAALRALPPRQRAMPKQWWMTHDAQSRTCLQS